MDLEALKKAFLEKNKVKYLDYYGNVSLEPRRKKEKIKPQGILTVYKPGATEEVL